METVRDIGISQPGQKPWADQWGIRSIALMMEATRTSEMLVNFYQTTRRYNPALLIALMMGAARTSETLVNFYQTIRRYNPLLIALMMGAARTFEKLVNFYQTTRHYNPENSHLRTHCHENLKSYQILYL
jgi:hypothetical protein